MIRINFLPDDTPRYYNSSFPWLIVELENYSR